MSSVVDVMIVMGDTKRMKQCYSISEGQSENGPASDQR